MPASTEHVSNRPLSGTELKEILRAKFEEVLEGEGLLGGYMAYGRVAFDITLRLHLDNAFYPSSMTQQSSTRATAAELDKRPDLVAIEPPPPLRSPSPDAVVSGTELSYRIDSPNAERLRHGLAVPVDTRGHDGVIETKGVRYPPDETLGPGDVTVTDTTQQARAEFGLPPRAGEERTAPVPTPAPGNDTPAEDVRAAAKAADEHFYGRDMDNVGEDAPPDKA